MNADVETVVIGAGVVGLATARALALGGHNVLVLEQHNRIGTETSSRNSEVIHAGLYYVPGSYKARFCVRGRELLYRFAGENGVTVARRGKLIVATTEAECRQIEAIRATAQQNGVNDLKMLTSREVRALEPNLTCMAACLSPSSGLIDSHGLMAALEGHVTTLGGSVVLQTRVTNLACDAQAGFRIATQSQGSEAQITAANMVIAAGRDSSALGRMLGGRPGYSIPATFLAKGHYFTLSGKAPFKHLIYPVPGGGSLGLHYTLDLGGNAKFGPDIEWTEKVSYAFDDPDGARRARFEASIRRYWPELPEGALTPGYTGLRPKLTSAGEPVADFAIHDVTHHGIERLVALYGIESPGLTSSLAIGEYIAALLRRVT